jgi:hypothetical protein
VIEPLPNFVGSGEAARYPRYIAGDHLLAETMKTFGYLRRLQEAGVLSLPASDSGGSFGRRERATA